MSQLASDLSFELQYALRRLRRSPGYTAVAILSLAIGIGATTSIFSVVRTLLLRPLGGLAEPERLVEVGRTRNHEGFDTLSWPDFMDYRSEAKSFSSLFGYSFAPLYTRVDTSSEFSAGMVVSDGYFETLGVRPALGRFFEPEEEKPGRPPVAVASHAYWRTALGSDPSALGRTIWVNGTATILVGVASESFRGHIVAFAPDLYLPMGALTAAQPSETNELFQQRRSLWLLAGGRLKTGTAMATAEVELQAIAERIQKSVAAAASERGEISVRLAPLGPLPAQANGPLSLFSTLLFVLVGLVLLVACANVAGMTLARTEARGREIAVRQSLGAPAAKIARQLLVESLLLFALAAAPALLLAKLGTTLLASFRPPTPVPIQFDFPLDPSILVFCFSVALASGLLFGLAPALRAARRESTPALRDAAPTGLQRLLGRKMLVGGQIALSLILLTAAGLLSRALSRADSIDIGFDPAGVETFAVDFELAGYREADGSAAQQALVDRLATIPGVEHAALAAILPMNFESMGFGGVLAEGTEGTDGTEGPAGDEAPEFGHDADVNVVTHDFFATLGIAVRGRVFDARDTATSPPVAVITESLARRLFPGGDALGRTMILDPTDEKRRIEVVGISRDGRFKWLGAEPKPTFFVPTTQHFRGAGYVLLESHADRAALARAVAAEVAAFDADLPRPQLLALESIVANSTLPQRIAVSVAGSLGTIGVGLAALGLYGLLAYTVARRGKEFAVRIALGARSAEIVRLVIGDAARPIVAGIAVGLAGAAALGFALRALLYGLPPIDPIAFLGAPALLALVALAAAAIPAQKATSIAPAAALRSE